MRPSNEAPSAFGERNLRMEHGPVFRSAMVCLVLFIGPIVATAASPPSQGEGRPMLEAARGAVQVKMNLNTVDETTLAAVDGIGSALAREIVKYRAANGPFRSVEDLAQVRGVGEAQLNAARGAFLVQ